MTISRSSRTNSNTDPRKKKQKAEAAAIRPQRIFRCVVKGLQTWNKTKSPVRLMREAETATISRHMGLLLDAGLVRARRGENRIYYDLNRDAVTNLCDVVCGVLLQQ